MNTVQRIAKNMSMLLVSQVASYIIGFFFIIYTARYLGAEGFGILSFALAFTGIFGVFADLGLSTLTVREVARDKSLAGKYLGNIAVMKIVLVVITFGLIAFFINLLGYPEQTIKVVYLIALSVIFGAFSRMFYSIFQAYEKMEYQSLGQILSSALMLSGALFAISQGFNVVGFASIYFFVSIVIFGYSFVICVWKFVLPKIEIDFSFWKPTIKEALPFFLSAVFSVIAFKIDIVLLSMMKCDMVVGWYSAAYRLIEVLIFIPVTFVGSIYPILSNFYVSSQESLKIAYQKSFKYLSIVGLPIAVGTTLLADKIILIIYNSDFVYSIIALQVLIWTIPIIFLTYMFGTMLASINRQGLILKILLLCMSLNVVMNLIFIPRYSYVGASIATVITELLAFILCYHFLSKFIYKIPIHKFIARPLMASAIMGLFILSFAKMNFFLLVCVSTLIYLGLLILLKTFSEEDHNLFKQIISINMKGGKRMNVRSIAGYVYTKARLTWKRIWYNYYLKNRIECKRNRKLLKKVRDNLKNDINDKNPLISVRIPTYNRGKILTERTIPSVLRQTYQNFEIIIVGDHCTDNTEELLKEFNDERIKFYNLPERGKYPMNPRDRWMVAGTVPANKALELCSGDWIAPLDDDDEFSEDHLEVLLNYALEHNYEMVYGIVKMEREPNKWVNLGEYPLKCGGICHLSVLYHAKLKFFKHDINAWKYDEPGDWSMWRRMKEAGVRIGFIDKIVGIHYLEGTQRGI